MLLGIGVVKIEMVDLIKMTSPVLHPVRTVQSIKKLFNICTSRRVSIWIKYKIGK